MHPITPPPSRDAALDLTRASITVLVIVHHAVLAYHRYAPPAGAFTRDNLVWGAFPVVDAAKAPGIDALTLWNDSFFMAMMFLLSGLFVPSSLARKGPAVFLRDRLLRLGVPFIVSAAVLAPLAYLPAYLQRAAATGHPGFWPAWRALGVWPAGPAWFLWVLLAFSALAAALHGMLPRGLGCLSAFGAWCLDRPARTALLFVAAAAIAYVPVTWVLNPFNWSSWGPFTVQTCRVPLYLLYFLVGCVLGSGPGVLGAWMTPAGPLARRWKTWSTVAGVTFVGFVVALITVLTAMGNGKPAAAAGFLASALFAASGVTTTFAILAWIARRERSPGVLGASLARSAFGMYLVHYAIVNWLQFALLPLDLPGLAKAAIVATVGVGASWLLVVALRRVPLVARVL